MLWRLIVLLALCTLTWAFYPLLARCLIGEWVFPLDDPWIHQVYARNLAEHGQYAFNVGEPSAGSSAPLWTLLMVPAHWLGLSPVLWALGWGLLSLAGLGAVTWAWAERRYPAPLPLLLTTATLLSPHLSWAGVEGMETALVAALSLLILWRLDQFPWSDSRGPLLDGLLNGLLLWLRPEAPLLTLVAVWRRRRAGWRRLSLFALSGLGLAVPYAVLHLRLGGSLLPQTVWAKIAYYGRPLTLSSVAHFLASLLQTMAVGIGPLAAVLLPIALWRMARRREWPWGPGLVWAGLTVIVAALRLPVVLHFARHFVPVWPPLLLASGEALSSLPRLGRQAVVLLGICLLIIGMVVGILMYLPACEMIQTSQVAMGRWIAAHLPPGVPVATHDVGAMGYFGRHPVVDTLALITAELTPAVAAGDIEAVLAYLQQHDVHYLAVLEPVHPHIQALSGIRPIVKWGRMVLLRLP